MNKFKLITILCLISYGISAQNMICPADVETNFIDLDDNLEYGEPQILTTDPYELTVNSVPVEQACDAEFLTIFAKEWTLKTANAEEKCTQLIQVVKSDFSDYETPDDIVEISGVDPYDIDPNDTGFYGPVDFQEGNMSNSYADQVLHVTDDFYKVIRTWVLLDWCTGTTMEYVQVLKVNDAIITSPKSGGVITGDGLLISEVEYDIIDGQGQKVDIGNCRDESSIMNELNCLHDLYPSETFTVTFVSKNDPLNGVSTLDMVLIQKHILGIQELPDNWTRLAADVNNSGSITAIDLIMMRKLILGIYSVWPEKDSWTFYNENTFDDLTFGPLDFPLSNLRIIGVKTGDVNYSVIR